MVGEVGAAERRADPRGGLQILDRNRKSEQRPVGHGRRPPHRPRTVTPQLAVQSRGLTQGPLRGDGHHGVEVRIVAVDLIETGLCQLLGGQLTGDQGIPWPQSPTGCAVRSPTRCSVKPAGAGYRPRAAAISGR